MSAELFISHVHRDRLLVNRLRSRIQAELDVPPDGIRCTSEVRHGLASGAFVSEALKRDIRYARAFLLLLTPHSVKSTWVSYEVGMAFAFGTQVLPLRAKRLKTSELPGYLQGLNVKSLEPGAPDANLDSVVAEIAAHTGWGTRTEVLQKRYDDLTEHQQALLRSIVKRCSNATPAGRKRFDGSVRPMQLKSRGWEIESVVYRLKDLETKGFVKCQPDRSRPNWIGTCILTELYVKMLQAEQKA